MIQKCFPFLAIAMAFLSSPCFGESIEVEVQVVASGSLGEANFSNQLVTITGLGDTSNVVVDGSINLLLDDLEVSVDVAGLGSAVFTDAIQAISNNNSDLGGFGNTSIGFGLLFIFDDAFATYDLMTDLDPVSGFGVIVIGVGHDTTAGALRLFSTSGDATFSADVASDCDFAAGDVNEDGAVDLLDVGPFVDLLTNNEFVCQADINKDEMVDLLDVSPFIDLLSGN
jgi:hypothetical protein